MRKYMKQIISWALVLIWMGLIFYMSAQPGNESQNMSKGVVEVVIQAVERVAPRVAEQLDIRNLHHLIRKSAHFFVYLVLGLVVMNALNVSGIQGRRGIILSLTICILYAISDEVHQLFVPGRSGEVMDVIIDSLGSSAGIATYLTFGKLLKQ